MRFWILLLPLLAAIGVAAPAHAAAMIDQADSGFSFDTYDRQPGEAQNDHGADTLDDFVYAGSVTTGDRTAVPQEPLFTLVGAMATAPEPGVWLLLVGGFALVGLTMRRRDGAPSLGHAQMV